MQDPVRFVILMPWGRVGSNLVASSLIQSARVYVDNEPTTRIRTTGHRRRRTRTEMGLEQKRHLQDFLEWSAHEYEAAGLKLSHRSLIDPRAYLGRLAEVDARVVLMVRENAVKCAVSQLRALARGAPPVSGVARWRSPWAVQTDEPKPGPSPVDIDEAIRLAQVFDRMHAQLLTSAQQVFAGNWHLVEYRDLAAQPQSTLAGVFRYLGLTPPDPIPILHRKATSDRLSDDIANYEEFRARASAAGLARFLSEGV